METVVGAKDFESKRYETLLKLPSGRSYGYFPPVSTDGRAFGALRKTGHRASGQCILNVGRSTRHPARTSGLNAPEPVRPACRLRLPSCRTVM
jgi:hypothetical protein